MQYASHCFNVLESIDNLTIDKISNKLLFLFYVFQIPKKLLVREAIGYGQHLSENDSVNAEYSPVIHPP